ncbi:MAG: O-antigen ligase family protein [Kiritimatiellae bacterium]|nr:O-antigen ligase family protein [Kiritimatiellia bacterium]
MLFFVRNAVVLQIFLLTLAYAWIDGGTRPDFLLAAVPWLAAFVIEMMLVFPQARSSESLREARKRVWDSLTHDPMFYATLLFTAYLIFPIFNVAGAPVFDPATQTWSSPQPPISWVPSCVRPDEHAVLLLWFPPVLFSALAAKHALLKRGKRILLECFCWNGAVLSILGYWQLLTHAKGIYWVFVRDINTHFFATFGYPNFAGSFFTLLFVISLGIWFGSFMDGVIGPRAGNGKRGKDETTFWKSYRMLIPTVLNFLGAFGTLSRAAMLLSAVCLLAYGLYMVVGVWQAASGVGKAKMGIAAVVVVFFGVLGSTILAPKALKAELDTITVAAVLDRVSGAGYHNRIASEIFADHKQFGVGGWGYVHYQRKYMTPEDKKHIQTIGGANVHNDTLQFLAEFGLIGFALLVLCLLGILVPVFIELVNFSRKIKNLPAAGVSQIPKPTWFYRLPPEVIAVFLGCTANIIHSLGDCPFRTPANQIIWFCALVCMTGYIPKLRHSS